MTEHAEGRETLASRAEQTLAAAGLALSPQSGVLLALSGGADSVFLLLLLESLAKKHRFPLYACHVEHGIRGEESLADAAFCRELCARHGIPFCLRRVDVPAEAAASGEGIEAAARRLRYGALYAVLDELGCPYLATAHHANDQAETILLHLLRGCGLAGLCGMPVLRDRLIRPLLAFSAEEIRGYLARENIPYCLDSTNADIAYSRNYLRAEVLPRLATLTPDPIRALCRAGENLREDHDALSQIAEEQSLALGDPMSRAVLAALPDAIIARVLALRFRDICNETLSRVHIEAAVAQIRRAGLGELACPGGHRLCIRRDSIAFDYSEELLSEQDVREGENRLSSGGVFTLLSGDKAPHHLRNVHKKAKKAFLSSAKIVGKLYLRPYHPGDAYRSGGMRRAVKKMFAARHLSDAERAALPLLCDEAGIVWIPGFGVRDGVAPEEGELALLALYLPPDTDS